MLFHKANSTMFTGHPLKIHQPLAILALSVLATSANAASVSVTADFSLFSVEVIEPQALPITQENKVNLMKNWGVSVNGQSVDICDTDPSCSGILNSGVKVGLTGSSVSFGYAAGPYIEDNAFSFVGNTEDVAGTGLQNQFKLGTFTFTNGGFAYFYLTYLDFMLTTHSSDANLDNHTFAGRIRLDVNAGPFPSTPEKEADYFSVQDSSGNILTNLGSVRVYDRDYCPDPKVSNCNTGSVDLYGHINSLHLDRFANPTGSAFLNASTGSGLTPTNPVPEPATLFLDFLGLAGLSAVRRYRYSKSQRR